MKTQLTERDSWIEDAYNQWRSDPTERNLKYLKDTVGRRFLEYESDREMIVYEKAYPKEVALLIKDPVELVLVKDREKYWGKIEGQFWIYGQVMDIREDGWLNVAKGHEGFDDWYSLNEIFTRDQDEETFMRLITEMHERDW